MDDGRMSDPRLRWGVRRIHMAWIVAAVTFVTMLGAAGFRAVPSVFMNPLHEEFGWSHASVGAAISVNLVLFGLMSPFAAALMDRFGIRPVVVFALTVIAAGSGLSVFMTAEWQLILLWGVLVGVGTGSMAMAFVATVTTRWFVARRGLVSGILVAAGATGQLIFLPILATVTNNHGWRTASLVVSIAAAAVIPLVLLLLPDHPHDLGLQAYGASETEPGPPKVKQTGLAAAALGGLAVGARTRVFWLLAGSFAICGMTTNGLIGTHFIPAATDHGMPSTTAAGLLALVGVFDIAGTVASGWFTDRANPALLLVIYYLGRGVALFALPSLLGPDTKPSTLVFVLFYGLDWVATVPPTLAICRKYFAERTPVVYGWIFASHQIGAAIAAWSAGFVRDHTDSYNPAFYGAAALCVVAAGLCLAAGRLRSRGYATATSLAAQPSAA
jgi:MFS family permease